MSSVNLNTNFDPAILKQTLNEVVKLGQEDLMEALTLYGVVLSNANGEPGVAIPIDAPIMNMQDLTLRMGILQEALNQLQTMMQKDQINARLSEAKKENQEKLKQIMDQLENAAQAAKKQQEAQKKASVIDCVANWVSAAVNFVSAAISVVTGLAALATGNVFSAVASFAAAGAFIAAGVINTTLAIDATIKVAGGKGFLSDDAKKALEITAMSCAIVGAVASLASGIGVVVHAFAKAGELVGQQLTLIGKEATKAAIDSAVKEGAKMAIKESVNMSLGAAKHAGSWVAMEVFKEALNVFKTAWIATVAVGVTQAAQKVYQGIGETQVQDMMEVAAQSREKADRASAALKMIEAMMLMINQMISDLQKQAEEMMERATETVNVVWDALESSQDTMENIYNAQAS